MPAPRSPPLGDLPGDEDDRVSDFVERYIRARSSSSTPPSAHTRLAHGRTALDIRADTARGSATVSAAPDGPSASGGPTATVALDSTAATLDASAATTTSTSSSDTSLDGRATGRFAPGAGLSGSLGGDVSHVRHDGGALRRVDLGGGVTAAPSGVSGNATGRVVANTGLGSVDVSGDLTAAPGDVRGGVRGHMNADTRLGTVDVTADVRRAPRDVSGSLSGTVRSDSRLGDVAVDGRISGRHTTSGVSGDAHLGVTRDAAGAHDTLSLDGRLSGGAASVDAAGSTRRDVDGGTLTARGDVHLGGDGARASGAYTSDRDLDGTRVRSDHGGSASYDDGRFTASGHATRSTVTTTDGVTVERDVAVRGAGSGNGGHVEVSGGHRGSSVDGSLELGGSARAAWASESGPAGTVTARLGDVRGAGSDRTSLTADARLDAGVGRLHADAHVVRDGRSVDVDATANLDVDAGGVRGGGSVAVSGEAGDNVRYRATVRGEGGAAGTHIDATATVDVVDPARGSATVDARGSVDVSGGSVSGTAGVDVTAAAGGDTGAVTVSAGGEVAVDGGVVDASGHAAVTVGQPSDPLSVRAEVRGNVNVSPTGVSGGGAANATVRTSSPALVTETSGGASTTGGAPEVRLTHTRDATGDGVDRTVEVSADLHGRSGRVRYTADASGPLGARRLDASLDVRTTEAELRVDRERPEAPHLRRLGGNLRVDGGGLVAGGELRLVDSGAGHLDGRASAGVSRDGRATLGTGVGFDHGAGSSSAYDGRAEIGRGSFDGLVTGNREWATSAGRIAIAFAGHIGRASDVQDKGLVSDVPALEGRRRVVLSSRAHDEVALGAGMTVGAVGGSVMGRLGRVRSAEYVTHVAPDDAEALVARRAEREIPDAAEPQALKVHDVLRLVTRGDVGMTADLSAFGMGAAAHATLRGEFAFTVEKLDDDTVRVSVEPREVLAVGVDGRALVLVAGIEGERAHSLGQTFDLDLSTASGVAAYADALEGRLPDKRIRAALDRSEDAVDLVDDLNDTLPDGVRAVSFTTSERKRFAANVGLSWTLFSATAEVSSTSGERSTALSGVVVHEREATRSVTSRTWLSGTETAGVWAVVEEESKKEGDATKTDFRELRFGARFVDDYVRRLELNDILAQLRDVFGLAVPDVTVPSSGEKRTVELSLRLDVELLEKLGPWQLAKLVPAAEKAGASPDAARRLLRKLTSDRTAPDRAAALKDFVASEGLPALGAVVRAFPEVRVDVTGDTSGYQLARDKAAETLRGFEEPIVRRDAQAFAARYRAVSSALEMVRGARSRAEEDPFLNDADRPKLDDEMKQLERRLEACLSLAHLTLHDLNTLRSGLTLVASIGLLDYGALDYIDYCRRQKGADD